MKCSDVERAMRKRSCCGVVSAVEKELIAREKEELLVGEKKLLVVSQSC